MLCSYEESKFMVQQKFFIYEGLEVELALKLDENHVSMSFCAL